MLFSLNTDFTGLTQDQAKSVGCEKSVDIDVIIEDFESRFRCLQKEILHQLIENNVDALTVINSLTLLPVKLKKGYEKAIQELLPFFSNKESLNKLFFHLNPLFSFLDYGLLEYIINEYGSNILKQDMITYSSDMCIFMKETTIKQLIEADHFPGQTEIPPKFSLIEAKIGEDASRCTLEQLNRLRKRYCSEVKLSEIVFHLVAVVKSNSFIVRWLVPSALVDDIIKSTKNLNQSFYQEYKITFFTLNGMWLFISKTETDAMWSRQHVSDAKFKDQFHTMYKQVVYELKLAQITRDKLSSYFKRSLKCHQSTSDLLSHELLNQKLPVSVVDSRVLAAAIEWFGSDCLKSVMSSYSKYISTFLKKSTAQQLTNLSAIHLQTSEYSIVKCRIKEEPSQYTLDKFFRFRSKFCTITDLNEFCFVMDEVNTEVSGSFTVSWLVSPAFISDILKSSRNVDQSFYQGYKITSLTLNGMWLYLSKSEIDAMWSRQHVSDAKFKDQFHTMYKQVVYELKLAQTTRDELSSYFKRSLKCHQSTSDLLSHELLNHKLPVSVVDFRVLAAAIEGFGSDCLKSVMSSYNKYISTFLKKSFIQKLRNSLAVQLTPSRYSIVKYRVKEEPSQYTLDQLFSLQTRFCAVADFSELYFVMDEVNTEMSGSFTVSWLVSPAFISAIIKSSKNINHSVYHRFNITSLILDGMWLHMSETEIDVLWSQMHVSDTKFKAQFHTMYRQIVYELEMAQVTGHQLSLFLEKSLEYHEITSYSLSHELLNYELPVSVVDFRVLAAAIEGFGSHCLKSVMSSYSKYISTFLKKSTAQQLINLSAIQIQTSEYSIVKCRIKEEASQYTLDKFFRFRSKFCTITDLNEFCFVMDEVNTEVSGSFTVSWLVSPAFISDILKSSRNVDQSFYQEYKIISLSLDGMWLHVNEAELEVMWLHMNTTELSDQFKFINKQIVLKLKIQNTPMDEVSQCLMNQHPNIPKNASIFLSKAILTFPFPPSGFFLDFDMLSVIIHKFGSDCLRHVMMSYCKFMSGFSKQLTVQQLLDLAPVPTKHHQGFIEVECGIMEEPSGYTCDKILTIKNSICAEIDFSGFMLTMSHTRRLLSDSFFARWLIPTQFAPDLMESANRIDSAFYVRKSVSSLSVGNQWVYNPKLILFGSKLKEKYQNSQCSPSPVEWIPSPTKKIFRLAMIQREKVQRGHIEDSFVRMTISGRVDDILHTKSPVELEHIFRNTLHGGEIILIEGAPGSGKSTLTVHICQRWGKGELFQQFTVVILVQLRDPAVQRAQTIADLLPIENAEEIATELIATNGRGILWVLDGWDELPPHLQQDSIFCELLPPKVSEQKLGEIREDPLYAEYVEKNYSAIKLWEVYLQNNPQHDRLLTECSVIITSRPISSGDLHPVVSSRIEVLGFTPEEQRQYFTECLKGDTKALESLLEKIQENPMVQSICYLPLNAAFIVHTFKYRDQSLPNTEYEIYLSVILSCIQRHCDREGRGHDLPRELASFDDLSRSEAVREPFQCLCELAYRGVMKNKVTFSSSDLPQGSNTLSLLQAIESFLQSGKSVFYNFLHLSVQEVLSAYYIIIKLSHSEQISQFQQLFNQPRFAAVFQFYAAITKLKSPGIRQVIDRIVEAKSKPLLVSLLRCLHEAQDPALCLYVAERLEYKLDINDTSLSPLDCLSVSFFLSSVAIKGISVNLKHCAIGDIGANCLSKYLHADNSLEYVNNITIDLTDNEIHEGGTFHITNMFYLFENLYLSYNPIGDTGASLISKAVEKTATLKTLILHDCGITSRGAEDLSRALAQNSSLKKLDIGGDYLGDEGISHVAEALKQNKQLKELWICWCAMTDKGAASLASALTVNNSLKVLYMGGSEDKEKLTKNGLSTIAQSLANKPTFVKLAIPKYFDSTTAHERLNREINLVRKRNGLPRIETEGEYVVLMCHSYQLIYMNFFK